MARFRDDWLCQALAMGLREHFGDSALTLSGSVRLVRDTKSGKIDQRSARVMLGRRGEDPLYLFNLMVIGQQVRVAVTQEFTPGGGATWKDGGKSDELSDQPLDLAGTAAGLGLYFASYAGELKGIHAEAGDLEVLTRVMRATAYAHGMPELASAIEVDVVDSDPNAFP